MNQELAGPTRATDTLEWGVIKEAATTGARWLQTGHSSTPGVAAFKERFGAVRVDYDEFVVERVPITRADTAIRSVVKRAVRFDEDATQRDSPPRDSEAETQGRAVG